MNALSTFPMTLFSVFTLPSLTLFDRKSTCLNFLMFESSRSILLLLLCVCSLFARWRGRRSDAGKRWKRSISAAVRRAATREEANDADAIMRAPPKGDPSRRVLATVPTLHKRTSAIFTPVAVSAWPMACVGVVTLT